MNFPKIVNITFYATVNFTTRSYTYNSMLNLQYSTPSPYRMKYRGNNSLVNELKNIIIESDSLKLDFGKRIV